MLNKSPVRNFLLDSSVVIKWFVEEEHSNVALAFRKHFLLGNLDINLPEFALYEIANALRYSNLYDANDVKKYLQALLVIDVNILAFSFSCLSEAVSLSFERNLAVYDAYFVACADENDMIFVTADREAYNKMRDLDWVVLLKDSKKLLPKR